MRQFTPKGINRMTRKAIDELLELHGAEPTGDLASDKAALIAMMFVRL